MSKVLFVCLGNICRSPTAEAIFRKRAETAGHKVFVDSAGTINWHAGKPPDARASAAAKRRGYEMGDLRARVIQPSDFHTFDYVLAMDLENLRALEDMRESTGTQPQLFMHFAPDAQTSEIPDPYYGDQHGFSRVIRLIERASDGLITHL